MNLAPPPQHVIDAAKTIGDYMAENGIVHWELLECASRVTVAEDQGLFRGLAAALGIMSTDCPDLTDEHREMLGILKQTAEGGIRHVLAAAKPC